MKNASTKTILSAEESRSIVFCEWLFNRVNGVARIRIGGEIAGFDPHKREVFINGYRSVRWMPAGEFLANLSTAEIKKLDDLPDFNGRNAYELSSGVLHAVSTAIKRRNQEKFRGSEEGGYWERIYLGEVVRTHHVERKQIDGKVVEEPIYYDH